MPHISALHERLQVTIIAVLVVLGIWGIGLFVLRRSVSNTYAAVLTIGALLIAAEALLGVVLLFAVPTPARWALHIVYGAVAALLLPGTYAYTRGRNERWEALIYALACFFLVAIAIRAWETAQM